MDNECQHPQLSFASGGFYICCNECNKLWVATKGPRDDDLDHKRRGDMFCFYEKNTP